MEWGWADRETFFVGYQLAFAVGDYVARGEKRKGTKQGWRDGEEDSLGGDITEGIFFSFFHSFSRLGGFCFSHNWVWFRIVLKGIADFLSLR